MSAPKPGSWIKKPEPKHKRVFILRPHLINRPLLDNPELAEFRETMRKGNSK